MIGGGHPEDWRLHTPATGGTTGSECPGRRDWRRGEPYAEVARTGRWSWYITVHHGIMQIGGGVGGGWFSLGSRQRADRKAARKLAAYRRRLDREADTHRITL